LPSTHPTYAVREKERYVRIFVGRHQVKTKFGRQAYTLGEMIPQVGVLEKQVASLGIE
jgi:hypothetical protein